MVKGKFERFGENILPMVPAVIVLEQAIQTPTFVLDTGFTGDIVVNFEIAKELGLSLENVSNIENANGQTVPVRMANAYAFMEGQQLSVSVLITSGRPLIGIGFMEKFGYKAVVDCKNKTVVLENV